MKIDTQQAASTVFSATGKKNWMLNGAKGMSDAKKEMLFSEFHSLLSSGIDFNRAFQLLIHGEKHTRTKSLLEELHRNVVRGDTLWQTFEKSNRFRALDCGVIRIGEETGRLGESLLFLSDYYHKKTLQKRMVSGAVSYPLIILATAIIVLVFMVLVIVPMFEQVYARMGGELPGMTRAVIAFSRNFKAYALILLILVGGIITIFSLGKNTDMIRSLKSRLLLGFPVGGILLKKHYQSHFCKLMYLLYSSGVPLLQGLGMLREIITFYPYRNSFDRICKGLADGESFAANIEKYPELYDQKLVILLKVGEETNRLSDMLRKQGEDLSAELEHKLKQLGSMLEPVLILFVGILVAVVLISMYLPMFKLGTTIY